MLEIGTIPDFALQDTDGNTIRLEDYRGDHNLFIYFMRALTCPQCNAAVRKIAASSADFEARKVQVLIAVPEAKEDAAAWRAKKNVPFPVVVGLDQTAHAEAGLLRSVFGLVQQSGSLLLDLDGVVRYTHAATNPGASYNAAAVASAIAALPTGPGL